MCGLLVFFSDARRRRRASATPSPRRWNACTTAGPDDTGVEVVGDAT